MYKKRLVNPLDTEARKLAWEALKKELNGRELAELLGCKPNTVNVWKRKNGALRLYPHAAEKLIELLDQYGPSEHTTVTDVEDATETPEPVRKDHVYMIPQIERQVVLIDLINRELNDMDADRLVGIYRAIMAKII